MRINFPALLDPFLDEGKRPGDVWIFVFVQEVPACGVVEGKVSMTRGAIPDEKRTNFGRVGDSFLRPGFGVGFFLRVIPACSQ